MALFKTYTKSLEIGPVDLQNTQEKDLKYLFLLVLFLVFYRLCALAEKKMSKGIVVKVSGMERHSCFMILIIKLYRL